MDDKLTVTEICRLHAPIGGQVIELQQVDWHHGGLSLLRVRIREGKRYTVFDLDAHTASAWAARMATWAHAHGGESGSGGA